MSKVVISRPIVSEYSGFWSPKPLTPWQQFWKSPLNELTRRLYAWRIPFSPHLPSKESVRIVCISDTHDLQPELADGDVLLHAGDLTGNGSFDALQAQLDWLNKQSHRYKVVIADDDFNRPDHLVRAPGCERKDLRWVPIIYLQNNSTTLKFPNGRQLNIYGSPWTRQFGTWAFQYPPIRNVFAGTIPPDTDILLTHGPPKYHLDLSDARGCPFLAREIWSRPAPLKLVVFGHIHEGHGREDLAFDNVQALKEELLLGGRGILSFFQLTITILMEWLMLMLAFTGHPEDRNAHEGVTLVNAAIAKGLRGKDARSPIVVEI
ncbi:MAG: hypothetical protein Q9224_007124 [Gallowayella concinna]